MTSAGLFAVEHLLRKLYAPLGNTPWTGLFRSNG